MILRLNIVLLATVLFLVSVNLGAVENKKMGSEPVFCFTIRKSGTHLLDTLLEYLNVDRRLEHLLYLDELERFLKGNQKAIVLVRDPRDVSVSGVYWRTNRWSARGPHGRPLDGKVMLLDLKQLQSWNAAGFDEKLAMTLAHILPLPYSQINREYELAAQALATGRALLVRFEELIGSQGGGSDILQDRTIRKIVEFLNISVSESVMAKAKEKLFGSPFSKTFRSGQIGSWMTHFKPEHVALCKKTMGQTLIDWGYESGFDW